jgi:murein DD-endopeptidase MepM/ murein hydrolase activator NlpD
VLFLALTAVPAGAEGAGRAVGDDRADGVGFRGAAARIAGAHERARARADRLRAADVAPARIRAADRHREALRELLGDRLGAAARQAGDPVAVDPSGRAGRCPVPARAEAPASDQAPTPAPAPGDSRPGDGPAWTAPTRHYWLSAGYAAQGSRWSHRHTGQDFAVPTGTPVHAVGPGTVHATTCGDGFGNQVVVRHPDGYFTQYAHLARVDVRRGQEVSAGERLGVSGATGNVTGPHLHFEVRITPYMGSAVAPLPWLRRKSVELAGTTPAPAPAPARTRTRTPADEERELPRVE